MELVTIPFSHFNERARWALNHLGQSPHERRYLPMFHILGALWATRGRVGKADRVSSPLSTPILLADGEIVHDSSRIVQWADKRFSTEANTLYPAPHREDILAFEQDVHDRLGAQTRLVAYFNIMQTPGLLHSVARANVGVVQATCFAVLGPLVVGLLKRRLKIDEAHAERAREEIDLAFGDYDAKLEGRDYLFGDRFSAADLTLAAIASPLLQPLPNYGATIPRSDKLPANIRENVDRLRATRTGRHAIRMFELHRT